jgi:hypothetical protein
MGVGMSEAEQVVEQNVQVRAFLLWEFEGRLEGQSDEYWHRARERIDAEKQSAYPPIQSSKHRH